MFYSDTRAVCGVKSVAAIDSGLFGDDAGIYAMKARFCDIYYLTDKTVDPATLK